MILALAGLILLAPPPEQAPAFGEIFPASALLGDATPGEVATYRIDQGQGTLEFVVGAVDRGGPGKGRPRSRSPAPSKDSRRRGEPRRPSRPTSTNSSSTASSRSSRPSAPKAWDRTWILRRIRRDEIRFLGRPLKCWRVECIDPALEPEQEAVVVWMHEDVPVFGILRFERAGRIYECTSWRPKS